MILSLSGFRSTNILRINSRPAWASLCGPAWGNIVDQYICTAINYYSLFIIHNISVEILHVLFFFMVFPCHTCRIIPIYAPRLYLRSASRRFFICPRAQAKNIVELQVVLRKLYSLQYSDVPSNVYLCTFHIMC